MRIINIPNTVYLKFLITALLIAGAPVNVSAQSNSEEISLTEQERAWIEEHPTITTSSNTGYAPLDFISAGGPAGLSIDYLNLLTSKVGLKVEYVNYGSWSENLKMGMEQKIDVIHSVSKTKDRQEYFTFSEPYFIDDIVLYGRVGSERINNINDLRDKRIGVIKDNLIFASYRQHFPDLNYVEIINNREALRALTSNEIDVYPSENQSSEFLVTQNNMQGLGIIGDEFIIENSEVDQRIAVHKNNPILMSIINKGIDSVTSEEFKAIFDKWIEPNQSTQGFKLTSEELDWLAENKVIKVSAEIASFPFDFIDEEGRISGISGDFLNEIAKRLNVEFVWAGNETWNDGLLKIKSHEADMIAMITPTKERQSFLKFSDVYLNGEYVIVSRNDSGIFRNINTLNGRTVVQIKGSAVISYLREDYPNIKVLETETSKEAHELLSLGGADAMIEDVTGGFASISNDGFENLSIVGTTPYSEGSAIGVSSELPLLSSAIQKALNNIDPATRSTIFNRWFLKGTETKIDYGPLFYVIGFAVFVGLIFLSWNRRLNVARREAVVARKQADEANLSKTMFLANMSHELRTPLNSLLLLSQNLAKNSAQNLTDKQIEHVDVIHNSGEELLQLVDAVLDFSRIEADEIVVNIDEITVGEISEYILRVFKPLTDEIGLDLTVTIDDALPNFCYIDKQHFFQILKNLISNAIKFTEKGSVSVVLEKYVSFDENEEQIKISVIDTGVGIGKSLQQVIFNNFSQGDPSTSRKYGGAGFGLTISTKLAELLGGRITVDSHLGKGSTFCLFLPLVISSDLNDTYEAANFISPTKASTEISLENKFAEELAGKTILLVDDDDKNVFSLSEVLNNYGMRSVIAQSGIEAIDKLKNHKDIDLVLMDMMMPGMDGDEAISRIRFTARGEKLPIISLTANAMPKHRKKCLDAGANDYLTKPIDIDTLLSKIRMWI